MYIYTSRSIAMYGTRDWYAWYFDKRDLWVFVGEQHARSLSFTLTQLICICTLLALQYMRRIKK